jgi:hypothetical protein
MSFAIYRTEKLKSAGAISASAAHNARTRITPNADTSRTSANRQLFGFGGAIPKPEILLAEWERRTASARRKPDAVLLQELFLGCSPEFFAELTDNREFDTHLDAWVRLSVDWLQREFGENLLSATLHLDETTPHIAAYVVPLMPAKDGSVWLSGKKLFNPVTLTQQQDRYAAAVAELGLQRGVRGSIAKHRTIRSYYGQIEQAENAVRAVGHQGDRAPFNPPPKALLESSAAYAARIADEANKRMQVLAHEADQVKALALQADAAKQAEQRQRRTSPKLSAELDAARKAQRELTDLVRDIPLPDVLRRLGWGDGQSEGRSMIWRTGEHAIAVTGAKWFDHKAGKGDGKSIDLVMHLMSCNFNEAVGWLAGQWTANQASAAVRVAAAQLATSTPKKTFADLWTYFAKPDAQATQLAREYLITSRGLSPVVVDAQIHAGMLHGSFQPQRAAAPRPWCVFRHLNSDGTTTGATLRALGDEDQPKRAIGDKTTAFFAIGPAILDADELVFVESPIDALSYLQRSERARVVSVGGSVVPDAALQIARTHQLPITVALDNDQAGEHGWQGVLGRARAWGESFVARLRRVVPRLMGWEVKDWNELLRAEGIEATRGLSTSQPAPLSLVAAQERTINQQVKTRQHG